MGAWVYMLQCRDGSYYVGSTRQSVDYRLSQHNSGLIEGYTQSRLPVSLVFSEYFDRITDAVSAERRIKGWSRLKKQALIAGDWRRVQALSRRGVRPTSFETPPDGGSSG
jgi:putative endonuclease